MPSYVFLVKWTDQGVKNAKDTLRRMQDGKALTERMGGRIISHYWTQGPYDQVITADMPDDLTASAVALTQASGGNITTLTLRAFSESEMEQIIQKMA
jgi:uncharacterized protein with GYD domain